MNRVPKRFRGPQNRRWSYKLWEVVRAGQAKAPKPLPLAAVQLKGLLGL